MRTVLTVARRELVERARTKAFVISNIVIGVAIVGAALVPGFLPEREPAQIAAFDDASRAAIALAAGPDPEEAPVALVEVADREAAVAAIEAGDADAALLDASTLLAESEPPASVRQALTAAAQTVAIEQSLAEVGLSAAQRAELLAAEPLSVELLAADAEADEVSETTAIIALVAVMALYGMLIMYGQWVGQGTVEEKQSRVIEVLLSTVTPVQLLAGKVIGIGLLGLAQVLYIASAGALALLYAAEFEVPPEAWGLIGLVLAWYVLGYAIYAVLFACVGAICPRVEEFQSAATPVFMLIFAAVIGVQFAINAPDGTVARVLGQVPFTAPLVQPVRAALTSTSVMESVTAALGGIVTAVLLVPLAARLYSGGVLRTGSRVSLREAWSSGNDR